MFSIQEIFNFFPEPNVTNRETIIQNMQGRGYLLEFKDFINAKIISLKEKRHSLFFPNTKKNEARIILLEDFEEYIQNYILSDTDILVSMAEVIKKFFEPNPASSGKKYEDDLKVLVGLYKKFLDNHEDRALTDDECWNLIAVENAKSFLGR